jgi:predicted metal-dependent hydrolase
MWFQEGVLTVAFKRREEPETLQAKVATFSRKALQTAAEQALEAFRPRLERLPKRIEICPLRPRILGQCTREGVIRLNESLATLPTSVMEETLAHELVHLELFNHSSAFWRRLSELLPDWLPRTLAHYLS